MVWRRVGEQQLLRLIVWLFVALSAQPLLWQICKRHAHTEQEPAQWAPITARVV
jgi:hypothetical protein